MPELHNLLNFVHYAEFAWFISFAFLVDFPSVGRFRNHFLTQSLTHWNSLDLEGLEAPVHWGSSLIASPRPSLSHLNRQFDVDGPLIVFRTFNRFASLGY